MGWIPKTSGVCIRTSSVQKKSQGSVIAVSHFWVKLGFVALGKICHGNKKQTHHLNGRLDGHLQFFLGASCKWSNVSPTSKHFWIKSDENIMGSKLFSMFYFQVFIVPSTSINKNTRCGGSDFTNFSNIGIGLRSNIKKQKRYRHVIR